MRIIKDNFNKPMEIITLRNGNRGLFFNDRILLKDGYFVLNSFEGNDHKRDSNFDIVNREEVKISHFTNMKKFIDYLEKEIFYEDTK